MSKYISRNLLVSIVLILFCVYGLQLFAEGRLTYYIHPRFIWFTVAANGVALVVLIASFINELGQLKARRSSSPAKLGRPTLLTLLTVGILVAGFTLPVKPLLSTAADQKMAGEGAAAANDEASQDCVDLDRYPATRVEDWAAAIATCADLEQYRGRQVDVTGFVYVPQGEPIPQNSFMVTRFVMSCCAVDARPVGILTRYDGWQQKHPVDSWVKVKGRLEPIETSGNQQLAIIPDQIEAIPEPDQPYEYYQPVDQQ